MVFSSLIFTFLFLPLVIIIHFIAKGKYRNYILLIASILFYGYGEPKFVYVMLLSVVVNYALAIGIEKARSQQMHHISKYVLWFDVTLNILLLFVYKYLDFGITLVNDIFNSTIPLRGIVLPIGISFFTFQAMSYVIDVYRGTVPAQKNPLNVALYISFFPQLVAGPIVRYSSIAQQIESRTCTLEKVGIGGNRFLIGFCKKVILANNLSIVADAVFRGYSDYAQANTLMLWLGAVCYTLQIYFDFSGYSDMAIGLGKIFGFDFNENFNYPYISRSVTEFWRRWHMSLSEWFRDYVYIPLGGSRVSASRHIFNLFVVWTLTGIWHGANLTFFVWGGYTSWH